ncbi:hypothetical protein BHE74_00038356 [Ensete ventricosum]|nr:hypothetical protein BHE74_00038356 [Ensete ventricosum]
MLRRYVYTTGVDGMVCQIDTSTGSILGRFRAFTKPISSMSVSAGKVSYIEAECFWLFYPGFSYGFISVSRFSLPSGKASYRSVHTGSVADRYVDRSLPGSTAKIDRCGRLTEKLTVGGRLKKKKGKEEEEKKKEVPGRRPRLRAARAPSSSAGRSRAVTALAVRGLLSSLRGERKCLPALGERPRRRRPFISFF